jgi:hypothetical protein
MGDLATYRAKIEKKLNEAEEQVRKFKEHLAMIDEEMGNLPQAPKKIQSISPKTNLVVPSPKSERKSFSQQFKEFILSIPTDFNIRGISQAFMSNFPNTSDIDEETVVRRASSVLWKLKKEKKIIVVHEGIGSEPNIYRVAPKTKNETGLFEGEDNQEEEDDDYSAAVTLVSDKDAAGKEV